MEIANVWANTILFPSQVFYLKLKWKMEHEDGSKYM